jgi:streptogramin lyase
VRSIGTLVAVFAAGAASCGEPRSADSQTSAGGPSSAAGTETSVSSSTADDGPRLDVGGADTEDPAVPGCPGGGFSHIWIANSPDKTVSKIDTVTGQELARYVTGPTEQAEPSRTSVSLYGDVAVANRGHRDGGFGGLSKIAARRSDCQDRNGNGEIETSAGPDDVLPWGEDECVLWNRTTPSLRFDSGPRPVAWEGKLDAEGCPATDPRLWFGWYDTTADVGRFSRLDGTTGAPLDEVEVPWTGLQHGPYGGAVDADGAFWVIGWRDGPLVRIDGETLEVDRIDVPVPPDEQRWAYGIALDAQGNPWVASAGAASVYDAAAGQWTHISTGNRSLRGTAVDDEERAWFAVDFIAVGVQGCGLAIVDTATRTLLDGLVEIPGCVTPVGVSIDTEGYVWVVDEDANAAFKIDPDTHQVEARVEGLSSPYTYSDMTGRGLGLVINPQG